MLKKIFHFYHIGSKKIQEDYYTEFKYKIKKKDILYEYECVFVFDGHGAVNNKLESCVYFIVDKKILYNSMKSFFLTHEMDENNLKKFFFEFDKILYTYQEYRQTGCCVAGIIYDVNKNVIYLVNIGDTSIWVYTEKNKLIYQTPVHNIYNSNELKRIEKLNKQNYICYKTGRYKKLLMTRTLGDFDCKEPFNEPLIAIPDIKILVNNKQYVFLIMTDGINASYNKEKIIQLKNDNKKLLSYCEENNKNNIKNNKMVDNICFQIYKNTCIKKESKEREKKERIFESKCYKMLKMIYEN